MDDGTEAVEVGSLVTSDKWQINPYIGGGVCWISIQPRLQILSTREQSIRSEQHIWFLDFENQHEQTVPNGENIALAITFLCVFITPYRLECHGIYATEGICVLCVFLWVHGVKEWSRINLEWWDYIWLAEGPTHPSCNLDLARPPVEGVSDLHTEGYRDRIKYLIIIKLRFKRCIYWSDTKACWG